MWTGLFYRCKFSAKVVHFLHICKQKKEFLKDCLLLVEYQDSKVLADFLLVYRVQIIYSIFNKIC